MPALAGVDAGVAANVRLFREPETVGPRAFHVLGPFPNEPGVAAKGRPGLDCDYLEALGGEASARLEATTTVEWKTKRFATREASLSADWAVDFVNLFGDATDEKTAYAYAEWNVAKPLRVLALFGSDDGAAIWLNGRQIHRVAVGRALDPKADRFEVSLEAGTNRLLVKVDNNHGAWGFAIRLLDDDGRMRLDALEARRHLERFGPAPASGSYLLDGSFPDLNWNPAAAAKLAVQAVGMQVRWYAPDLAETRYPEARGQYTAVIDAQTLDGFSYRHMLTFAKVPEHVIPHFRSPPLTEMPLLDVTGRTDLALNEPQRAELSRYLWRGASEALSRGEDSAIAALAFMTLGERPPPKLEPLWLSSGFIQAAEHRLRLRMRLEGRTPKSLNTPERLARPAPELRSGSELQAGFRPGTVEKLRAIGRAWAKDDPHPFVVLVARRGIVTMSEGYNGFGKDSLFWPASITKTIAALTFSRAVEQGLVDFDQPVATLLSDWKDERTAGVTFRHCFYHVAGLSGHASHDGLFNTYLDNALFVEDAAFVRPGEKYVYNGDDINLTGRALELLTGQSIWRLLYEQMQKPFAEPVSQLDLGCCGSFTAMYLAKVGQMILQDGQYGAFEFFKPGFLDALRPRRIAEFAPDIDDPRKEAGIGFAWMPDPPGPRDSGVLGPEVIGHGAASGTIWRVDKAHELVIVVGRDGYRDWNANEEWTAKFVRGVAESLVN